MDIELREIENHSKLMILYYQFKASCKFPTVLGLYARRCSNGDYRKETVHNDHEPRQLEPHPALTSNFRNKLQIDILHRVRTVNPASSSFSKGVTAGKIPSAALPH